MTKHHKIDYIEWPTEDLGATKAFYTKAFGWGFVDYGPHYAAVSEAGLEGGFDSDPEKTEKPLIILYSKTLEQSLETVVKSGGVITKPIFAFPGGRRFQFKDPSGNELGVWSDK
jgi:uncharacterized protein